MGYISFKELKKIKIDWLEVYCETEEYWKPIKAVEIKRIRLTQDWRNKETVKT